MDVVFLFHHIDDDDGFSSMRIAAGHICMTYGYHLINIDLVGNLLEKSTEPYASLDEALVDPRFTGWTWVFFDPKAPKSLDTFTHPVDKVVYVFGSDNEGFGIPVEELPGETLHLKSDYAPTYEHFAITCLTIVAVHRFYQVDVK